MKHILLFLIGLPLLSLTTTKSSSDFIGRWEGEDEGEIGYLIIDEEGYAAFEFEGETMGGKSFLMEDEEASMTYEINTAVDPIEVDFIITFKEDDEEFRMLGIAKFLDENSFHFAMDEEERPTAFTDENSIIFKRVD